MSLNAELMVLKRTRLNGSSIDADDLENIVNSITGVSELSSQAQEKLCSTLMTIFDNATIHWEVCSFCIKLLMKLCILLDNNNFVSLVIPVIFNLLEHEEPRVRMQACELISAVCRKGDSLVHINDFNAHLLQKLLDNLHRTESSRVALLGEESTIALDDTTGWNYLESYLQAVYNMIIGHVSFSNHQYLQTLLINVMNAEESTKICDILITITSTHQNRYIREMTYAFISNYFTAWKTCGSTSLFYNSLGEIEEFQYLFNIIVDALQSGMQDNWSQIRLKATKATYDTLLCLVANSTIFQPVLSPFLSQFWSRLLPGLCLNRYYTAEAVGNAALSVWKNVVGTNGKALIVEYSKYVVEYYITMSQSGNHMIAEAACASIGEFVSKIDRVTVLPFVEQILSALTQCLNDERWPVKDQACLPSGILIRYFPIESKHVHNEYLSLWNKNLQDCIWSVRENAAFAYASAIQCDDVNVQSIILHSAISFIDEYLLSALTDKPSTVKPSMKNFSFLPPSMLAGRPVGYTEDKIASLVTNLPKKSWGCCVDCVELRQSLPWEITQGAVYLIRELSKILPNELNNRRLLKNNQLISVEGPVLSYMDSMWSMLNAEGIENSEKLYNALYEEIPTILVCKEVVHDWKQLINALSRDLSITSDSLDLSANKNAAKYKVNRLAAASTDSADGDGSVLSLRSKNIKPARRLMAEKCIERLISNNCISKIELISMFDSPQKEIVETLLA